MARAAWRFLSARAPWAVRLVRTWRERQSRPTALAAYRVARLFATALLQLRPRERAGELGRAKVHVLIWHAWAMGGTVRTTLNVAGYLARKREVEIVSVMGVPGQPFFKFPDGVPVTMLDDRRPGGALRNFLSRRPSRLVHPADFAADGASLWTDVMLLRALWRVRSGIVLATRPALNLVALTAARPGLVVVGEEHINLSIHRPSLQAEVRRRYGGLDALVVLTEPDRRDYAAALGAGARIERIPNAVPRLGGPPASLTGKTALAVGRLSPQKGFDRLIDAFALIADELPGWTVRILGDGPRQERLERRIVYRGLEGRVVLAGRSRWVGREMGAASLFVLSSRFEGFPMVMIEAMSKGLPIVAFDCPTGPAEVIETGRNGFLVPNGDVEGLADGMRELMQSDDLRKTLGAAAEQDSRRYAIEQIGPRWSALLTDLAEGDAP